MESIQKAPSKPSNFIEVFFSYAHEDEELRNELAKHLKLLERQGVIKAWSDRNITAGEDWRSVIDERLESANVILLLISADFLASDYCYDVELDRALDRHKRKEARVIPVILRSSDWQNSSFGKLTALPTGGKAITSWLNEDEAFTDVVKGLRKAINQIQGVPSPNLPDKMTNNVTIESERWDNKILIFGVGIACVAGLFLFIPQLLQKLQESPSLVTKEPVITEPKNQSNSTQSSAKQEPKSTNTVTSSPVPKENGTNGSTKSIPPSPRNPPKETVNPAPKNQPTVAVPPSSSTPNSSPVPPSSPTAPPPSKPNNTPKKNVPVIIEYDGSKNKTDKVEELKLALEDKKIKAYSEDLSKRKDANKFKILESTEIRYYSDQDKEQSEEIKDFLASKGIKAIIPKKSAGTEKQIEIWLSPNAL